MCPLAFLPVPLLFDHPPLTPSRIRTLTLTMVPSLSLSNGGASQKSVTLRHPINAPSTVSLQVRNCGNKGPHLMLLDLGKNLRCPSLSTRPPVPLPSKPGLVPESLHRMYLRQPITYVGVFLTFLYPALMTAIQRRGNLRRIVTPLILTIPTMTHHLPPLFNHEDQVVPCQILRPEVYLPGLSLTSSP